MACRTLQRQAIIWTNDGLLSVQPQGTYLNEILIKNLSIFIKKMHLKVVSGKMVAILSYLSVLM